ncbi:MAG: hypothetical protein ABWZ78_00800 [Burkholderiaceae bacterium]
MLTARAEYRLRLRANNATTRLTPLAIAAGCVAPERAGWFARREGERRRIEALLDRSASSREFGRAVGAGRGAEARSLREWLRLPEVTLATMAPWIGEIACDDAGLCEEIEEDATYAPYLARQDAELRDLRASEMLPLDDALDFSAVPGLSKEMAERLTKTRPATLGAAGRVPGITPAALAVLLVHASRGRRAKGESW